MSENKILVYYFQITDLWKKFCELHTDLLEKTSEEYQSLLGNNIDSLNIILEEKQSIIDQINNFEMLRQDVIQEINSSLSQDFKNIRDLITFFSQIKVEKEQQHLLKYNTFLISTIEQIQKQNKTNQIFLNKAINSLREIREGMSGTKSYKGYNQQGQQTKT